MRSGDTYRGERRNEWREFRFWDGSRATWPQFNQPPNAQKGLYGAVLAYAHSTVLGRSKYRPHQGKRELARRKARLNVVLAVAA